MKRNRTLAFFLVCFCIMTALNLCSCSSDSDTSEKKRTVKLGALLPLTGSLVSVGESAQAAVTLATEDINAYLRQKSAPFLIEVRTADTGADPQTALVELMTLKAGGIDLLIGPVTSSESANIIERANTHHSVLISQCTAPYLAIAGDNLFRLVPDDSNQAELIAYKMISDGMKAIVPVYRHDVYAMELLLRVGDALTANASLTYGVPYVQGAIEPSDIVLRLKEAVRETVAQHGALSVGVYLIAFEEGVDILSLAGEDPVLSEVTWYGSDSLALDSRLIKNADAARFAANREIVFPAFESNGGVDDAIAAEMENRIGRRPESEALQIYDALWIGALAYLKAGFQADTGALRSAIPEVAETYSGATGDIRLNDAGDRMEGTYATWTLQEDDNAQFHWAKQH